MNRKEQHRHKMVIKLAQRGTSNKRLERAVRAYEKESKKNEPHTT